MWIVFAHTIITLTAYYHVGSISVYIFETGYRYVIILSRGLWQIMSGLVIIDWFRHFVCNFQSSVMVFVL